MSQKMEPLSLRSTSRGVLINMLAIRFFFLMLETEELISKIGSLHILQEASELKLLLAVHIFIYMLLTFVCNSS